MILLVIRNLFRFQICKFCNRNIITRRNGQLSQTIQNIEINNSIDG